MGPTHFEMTLQTVAGVIESNWTRRTPTLEANTSKTMQVPLVSLSLRIPVSSMATLVVPLLGYQIDRVRIVDVAAQSYVWNGDFSENTTSISLNLNELSGEAELSLSLSPGYHSFEIWPV